MFPVVMFFFGPYSDLCSVSGSGRSNRPCTATDLPRVESPMVPSCHGVNQASHLLSHVATTAKPTGDPASRSRRWIIYILMMLLDLDTGWKADAILCNSAVTAASEIFQGGLWACTIRSRRVKWWVTSYDSLRQTHLLPGVWKYPGPRYFLVCSCSLPLILTFLSWCRASLWATSKSRKGENKVE